MKGLIVSAKKCGFNWKIVYINSDNVLANFDSDVSSKIKWDEKIGHRFEQNVLGFYTFSDTFEMLPKLPVCVKTPLEDGVKIEKAENKKIFYKCMYLNVDCLAWFDLKNDSVFNPEKIAPGKYLYKCTFGCNVPNINAALGERGYELQKCPRTGNDCTGGHWQALDECDLQSLEILHERNNVRPPRKAPQYRIKMAPPRRGTRRFAISTERTR